MSSGETMQVPALVTTQLVVVATIFPIISLASLFFRWKARNKSHRTLTSDDWWLIVTWIFTFGISITIWVFAALGGIDYYDVDPYYGSALSNICLWTASFCNQIGLATVKIAILLFYKHVFFVSWFRIVTWITIGMVTAWGFIFFFLVLFYGDPVSKAWTGEGRWRYDVEAVGLANVGTSIALDVLVLCLPLPVISRLHLPLRKKVGVALIFWLGIFCCAAAIVRIVLLKQVLGGVASNEDLISTQSLQFIFLVLEPHVSMIAASLPCYGPLLANMKAPESMLRSVRSLWSLGSRGSGQQYARTQSRPGSKSSNQPSIGSNIELYKRDGHWVDTHTHNYTVSSGGQQYPSGAEIAVTREFNVVGSNDKGRAL